MSSVTSATISPGATHRVGTRFGWLLFAFFFFCFSFVHQSRFNSATPVSRLDLLHAVYVKRAVNIDDYHRNTPDKAKFSGHYFSDKAPGTIALALPPFWVAAAALESAGVDVDSRPGWLVTSWISCALSLGIAAAAGAVAMFVWLCRYVPARTSFVATLALFLGAAPLPYATLMFSHSLVVGCIAIALWAVDRKNHSPKLDCVAGFCCGWALASEYTAGIVIVGMGAWIAAKGWKRAARFGTAAFPPLLLIPLYSWICFGNPFLLPYSAQASFPEMKQGLFAIKWPDFETAVSLLFLPTRGLFFWTPFLLVAGFGFGALFRRSRGLFWLAYAVALLQIVVISGRTWDWQAGFTLGPRYLAPLLPLLALPCALGFQRIPRTGLALALYSVAITALATITDACPHYSILNPLTDLHLPLLMEGKLSPNLALAAGLPPWASVGVFCALIFGGGFAFWHQLPRSSAEASAPVTSNEPSGSAK